MTDRNANAAWRTGTNWRLRRQATLMAALTVPALIITTQLYTLYRAGGAPISFVGMFLIQLCHWELWSVVGPAVWSIERRWPFDASHRREAIVRHAVAAPLVAATVIVLYLLLYHILIRVPGLDGLFAGLDRSIRETTVLLFAVNFHVELLVYLGIVAAAHASRTSELLRTRENDALRLKAELTDARLTALRTQLQPHFLFNTLHTIGSFVLQRENERAVQLLAELGELLRATLAHRDSDLAPLGEELSNLRRYLRIEEARFGDRLRVEWRIEPAAEGALIPPFILQPIVENAFRHGISHRTEESALRIGATVDDGWLRVTVYNDGPPLATAFSTNQRGYGLRNVKERLNARTPAGRVELANDGAGVRVTLVMPLVGAAAVGSTA